MTSIVALPLGRPRPSLKSMTDSCSGPDPFAVFLSGGLRDTPGGDFQVSADGQSIDAEWKSDEASFELHLEASSSF
jgi:hypothetical protein